MKRDLRLVILLSIFLVPFTPVAEAQPAQPISSVRVYSNPTGARFVVDGTMYTSSQTFLWPAGSKHVLQFPQAFKLDGTPAGYQESLDGNTHYTVASWTLANGTVPTTITDLVVIADPTISTISMNVSVSYRIRVRYNNAALKDNTQCSTNITPQDTVRAGIVILNGNCYASDAEFFASAGILTALAYPFPGWVFGGWASNGGPAIAYSSTIAINGPTTIVPQFIQAKRVNFRTDPAGFNILVDRTPTPTLPAYGGPVVQGQCPFNLSLPPLPPLTIAGLCLGEFDFIPGSSHTIGAPSPQYDNVGKMWIIDSFSNGLKPNDTLVVSKDLSKSDTITAKFVPGIQSVFLTSPGGLKLSVDGRSNWITYDFAWGVGTTHTVTAADQVDAKGRRWTFKGWSNGGSASQTLTVGSSLRWTAIFEGQPQLTLQSNPPGLSVQVDGSACNSPCVLSRPSGSTANLSVPATIPITDSSRLVFTSWSDGGASSHAVTFDGDRVLTLNYESQFRLAAVGDPSQGVTFTFDPPSADQFFAQDSGVTVKAQTKGGYRFRRWDGDLRGTYNQGTVVMGAPRAIVALLDRVPFISPAGIHNAAGATPDGTIAPGSLIAIAGESLTADYQAGRTSPLAQGIADITVTVNDRLLPLVFVSPQEIRAQMLSDLPDGDYNLTVHSVTQADVVGQFTVARNAPGLFPAPVQPDPAPDTPYAWALHADGTAISADSPALHGETVTVYGTGFGPVSALTFDAFPPATDLKLKDQLQVQAGDTTLDPNWSGALGGQVGVMAVKFTVTDDLPTATSIKVAVVVNGKSSNAVLLPLQ